MMKTSSEGETVRAADGQEPDLGIYVHVPFCLKKCRYCDFLSWDHCSKADQASFTTALLREIDRQSEVFGNGYSVNSIFFGGGTPSVLDAAQIAGILDRIQAVFSVREDAEISLEANPGTVTPEKLSTWRTAGLNRLSLGVQSLDDSLLTLLGRIHTRREFFDSYRLARTAGFDNISLDLMFAIPGQTVDGWRQTLTEALDLNPEHLSFYCLTFEKGTELEQMRRRGLLRPVDEKTDRIMYDTALASLSAAGYRHYEISNAARLGHESRHNLKYWSMKEYLGLGPGAHSYLNHSRLANSSDLLTWLTAKTQEDCLDVCHKNTLQEDISEYLFTGLRKTAGIDPADFSRRFNRDIFSLYGQEIRQLSGEGLLHTDGRICLSRRGLDLCNRVFSAFV